MLTITKSKNKNKTKKNKTNKTKQNKTKNKIKQPPPPKKEHHRQLAYFLLSSIDKHFSENSQGMFTKHDCKFSIPRDERGTQ